MSHKVKNTTGAIVAYSQVSDGNMAFKWGEHDEVRQDRRWLMDVLALNPSRFMAMQVEAGERIVRVGVSEAGQGMATPETAIRCDSMFTTEPGVGLWLLIADCLPITIWEPGRALALVHVGWRGADLEIVRQTVEALVIQAGCTPANLQAIIGPGISPASYIMLDPAQRHDSRWQPYLDRTADGYAIDVAGFASAQLGSAGLIDAHIRRIDEDTATSLKYFSHYRAVRTGEPEGRFAAVSLLT